MLAVGTGAFIAVRANREQEPNIANSADVSAGRSQMVSLPGGTFQMGSEQAVSQKPVHAVTVKTFAMDRTEVTVDAYAKCVSAGGCSPAGTGHDDCNAKRDASGDEPINCVTFPQAEAYCEWRHARLPTEEEWEYAARGKEGRVHPWGDGHPKNRACYLRKPAGQRTCSVASHPVDKTPEGIFDLGGNVAEWTTSAYCNYDGSDCKPGHRVTRGGSWDMLNPAYVRSSFRDFVPDAAWGYNLGFRCVKDE
jgi:formylglycine-generating enzyme required for sulfatase activity